MKAEGLKSAILSAIVAAACSLGITRGPTVVESLSRDAAANATNLVITSAKRLDQIQFDEQVPIVQMVDTNGNFYLPCGTDSDTDTNILVFTKLMRTRISDDSMKQSLSFSSNYYYYANGAFIKCE